MRYSFMANGHQAAFPIPRLVGDHRDGAVISPLDVEHFTAAPDIETVRQVAPALLVQQRRGVRGVSLDLARARAGLLRRLPHWGSVGDGEFAIAVSQKAEA